MISKTKLRLVLLCLGIINSCFSISAAGQGKKALFIGNSLTYFNDMPQTVKAIGAALGDTLDVTVYAPGGTGFVNHHVDPNVFQHFSQGNWDYIILQPGSNESPAFSAPIDSTLKWGRQLTDSARMHNPCAKIFLYEISYGVAAASGQANINYYFAQSRIKTNLIILGDSLHTAIVPAGETMCNIWAKDTNTLIWNAFGDIHPNAYGSYAIACTFASTIFKKPTTNLRYYNGLDSMRCKAYQRIADSIVFTTPPQWNTGIFFPNAKYTFNKNGNQVNFQNQSLYYDQVSWSFGDGTTSQLANPNKTYTAAGTYRVTIKALKGACYDEYTESIVVEGNNTAINPVAFAEGLKVYPNPASEYLNIDLDWDKPVRFSMYNVLGIRVMEQEIKSQHTRINISNLSPGIYMYTAASGAYKLSGKISKQ